MVRLRTAICIFTCSQRRAPNHGRRGSIRASAWACDSTNDTLVIQIARHSHLELLLHHILLLLLRLLPACCRVVIGVLRLEAGIQVGVGLIDTIEASLDDAGMLQM